MTTTHTLACLALATACALPATATEPRLAWEWDANPEYGIESMQFHGTEDFHFADVIASLLDGSFALLAHAETNEAGPLNIRDVMVKLWRSNADDDYLNGELIGGFDFDSNMVQMRANGRGRGDYFHLVEGIAEGSGSLLFSASIAAVPEPQTWALMLAGPGRGDSLARHRLAA